MENERLEYLLSQWMHNGITREEKLEMIQFMNEENMSFFKEVLAKQMQKRTDWSKIADEELDIIAQKILDADKSEKGIDIKRRAKIISISRWAAAAIIVLMITTGAYFLFFNHDAKQNMIKTETATTSDVKAPETARAMLT